MTVHTMSVQDAYICGFALPQTDMSPLSGLDLILDGLACRLSES